MTGIDRHDSSGNYSYSLKDNDVSWSNKPVNYINFWDACRFVNWLHNGQPKGLQDVTTTEDGAYTLENYNINNGKDIKRNDGALFFIPSEDEWYKAAYYKGGGIESGYWDYAIQSNVRPVAEDPPGTNLSFGSANYNPSISQNRPLTDVGAYTTASSISFYGTFDQAGNVAEWTETVVADISYDSFRVVRVGSAYNTYEVLNASFRDRTLPPAAGPYHGFRIAAVPEPSTLLIFGLGAVILRKRKK
jgi:hypothetical protein